MLREVRLRDVEGYKRGWAVRIVSDGRNTQEYTKTNTVEIQIGPWARLLLPGRSDRPLGGDRPRSCSMGN